MACRARRRTSETRSARPQPDQLNLKGPVSAEILTRVLAQGKPMMARNSRSLDLADLDGITDAAVSEQGALVLPDYQRYVDNLLRGDASALEQRRPWAEEQAAYLRRHADDGRPPGGQPGGRDRGKGSGADAAAAAGAASPQ